MKKSIVIVFFIFFLVLNANSQSKKETLWNGKRLAVVLTYDDGLDVHLDNVVPVLDSLGFYATFYVHGNSASLYNRTKKWEAISINGHEIGSHSLFHPCNGKSKDRDWVGPDYDLDNYSIDRIRDEIRLSGTLFNAIDGKTERTFAYPCGDTTAKDSSYIHLVKNDFTAARLVGSKINLIDEVDLFKIYAFSDTGRTANDLINLVKSAKEKNALIVLLFHGVGGGHALNISLSEHNKLMDYLKTNEGDIWIAPMVEVAEYIKLYQETHQAE